MTDPTMSMALLKVTKQYNGDSFFRRTIPTRFAVRLMVYTIISAASFHQNRMAEMNNQSTYMPIPILIHLIQNGT